MNTGALHAVLRATAVAALAVSAYLHVDLAEGPVAAAGQVTLAGLFLAQAVVATATALALLVRPVRAVWLVAALVGGGSLLALVVSVYAQIPAVGVFPSVYEPFWYPEKVVAAVAAGAACAAAAAGLRTGDAGRSADRSGAPGERETHRVRRGPTGAGGQVGERLEP